MDSGVPYPVERVLSSRRFVTSDACGGGDVALVCAVCSAIVYNLATHYGWAQQVEGGFSGPHRAKWIEGCREWPPGPDHPLVLDALNARP